MKIFVRKHYSLLPALVYTGLINIVSSSKRKTPAPQATEPDISSVMIVSNKKNEVCERILRSNGTMEIQYVSLREMLYCEEKNKHVIFIPSDMLPYRTCIEAAAIHARQHFYYWFSETDRTIICSSDKTSNGIVLTDNM